MVTLAADWFNKERRVPQFGHNSKGGKKGQCTALVEASISTGFSDAQQLRQRTERGEKYI